MCNCMTEVNKKLAEQNNNTAIKMPFMLDNSKTRAMVVTVKADTDVRKKPMSVFATFCPFCGDEY